MTSVKPSNHQPDYTLPLIKDWTPELRACREATRSALREAKRTAEECRAKCGKSHSLECPPCSAAVVRTSRARYFTDDDYCRGPEDFSFRRTGQWFTGRHDFLRKLWRLYERAAQPSAAAAAAAASLRDAENMVRREKKAYYRDMLRAYPFFFSAAENSVGADEFYGMLDDKERPVEDVARVVRRGIGRVRGRPVNLDDYLAAVGAARDAGDERKAKEEAVQSLFEVNGSGKILEGSEKYADMYRTSDMSIEQIIDAIDRDRRTAASTDGPSSTSAPAVGEHARRAEEARRALGERAKRHKAAEEMRSHIDELQRARTAHKKEQNDKSEKKRRQLPRELYDLPPCAACARRVDGKDVVACALCQVLVDMGLRAAQTAYCSVECFSKGHEKHVEQNHSCEAGKYCLKTRNPSSSSSSSSSSSTTTTTSPQSAEVPTPNLEPKAPNDEKDDNATLCKECVNQLGKVVLYCSAPCAAHNLRMHLEEAHPSTWQDVVKARDEQHQQQRVKEEASTNGDEKANGGGSGNGGKPGQEAGARRESSGGDPAPLADVGKFVEGLEDVFRARIGEKLAKLAGGKAPDVKYLPR